ncbi:hypothetical protein M3Y94_00955700 [Aphelenchoides besseyi]|nr:hypothetical protein M3Y94_00955700 [Aphelenchoides besseyi]
MPLIERQQELKGKVAIVATGGNVKISTAYFLHLITESSAGVKFIHFGDLNVGGLGIFFYLKFGSLSSFCSEDPCKQRRNRSNAYRHSALGDLLNMEIFNPTKIFFPTINCFRKSRLHSYEFQFVKRLKMAIKCLFNSDRSFHQKLLFYKMLVRTESIGDSSCNKSMIMSCLPLIKFQS